MDETADNALDNALPAPHCRRATLEDVPELKKLWQDARWESEELEKRFTEFQVATGPGGQVIAALGLHHRGQEGQVHSEVFLRPEMATELRPILWQRLLNIARNNGLARLWALPTASFYREQGMADIDDALRAKLPEGFGNPLADWVTLKLKDESAGPSLAEQQFALFKMSQEEAKERATAKAQAFRVFAYFLLIASMAGLVALLFLFKRLSNRQR